jgi:putative membrane protein
MPPVLTFFATWRMEPVALGTIVLAFLLYTAGIVAARRRGGHWPLHRALSFYLLGLGSYAWVSFGFLGAYSTDLRWAFTTRIALLLLVVPALMSLGRPVLLAQAALSDRAVGRLDRFLDSRLIRFTGNAVFEPLFSLGVFLVFLTPFSGLVRGSNYGQWAVTVLIPAIGLLTIIPIFENTTRHTSFFVMVEFVLAFAAFVFDPIPGILLRINETVLDQVASPVGMVAHWFPNALRDQQLSGDILWFLAEILDVPVLIILIIRWNRIDRTEAKSLDDLSDAEMEALTRAHLRGPGRY